MPVSRIGAAALAAAASLCAFPGCASDAQDAADAAERILLFSGVELSRTGNFLFGGFVWSPDGIGAEGFAMKTLVGHGTYRHLSGAQEITGRQMLHGRLEKLASSTSEVDSEVWGGAGSPI